MNRTSVTSYTGDGLDHRKATQVVLKLRAGPVHNAKPVSTSLEGMPLKGITVYPALTLSNDAINLPDPHKLSLSSSSGGEGRVLHAYEGKVVCAFFSLFFSSRTWMHLVQAHVGSGRRINYLQAH
eukprot:1013694-Pelagomonas_calceolata.AAC.4